MELYNWKKGKWEPLQWKHFLQGFLVWAVLWGILVLPMLLVFKRIL